MVMVCGEGGGVTLLSRRGGGAGVFWSGNCYMVMYSYTCAEVEHSELEP